jgi:hypothetical protein
MTSSLAPSLLIALIAGTAAALMSGLVVPSSAPLLMLSLLAPAPLMIAGFGWHPLVAALGGLIAAFVAQQFNSTLAAIMISVLIAGPAYGVTALSLKRFGMLSQRPQRDGKEMGGIGVLLVMFLALSAVLAAMAMEPDFEALSLRLRKALEASIEIMTGMDTTLPAPRTEAMSRLYDFFARIFLPISTLVTLTTLTISATLGVQVAERAGLLRYPRPDFRRFAVPGGGLILIGLALITATRPGYLGALGDGVLAGMLFLYLLQGLAVIHTRTLGVPGRGVLLFLAWGALIFFGFPAFLFMLVGFADHLLDFRRGRL